MNVLTIVFGVSMLAGLVLALNGCVLLAVLFLLRKAERLPTAIA